MNPWTKNPVTGQFETTFNAVVTKIGETLVSNTNGTDYVIGSIVLPPPSNKTVSARVLVKHADRIKVGEEHVINATKYTDTNGVEQIDLRIAPFSGAARAITADMAFLGNDISSEVPASETGAVATTAKVGAVETV